MSVTNASLNLTLILL